MEIKYAGQSLNHTFYLHALTDGKKEKYMPIHVNIYDCGQVHVSLANNTGSEEINSDWTKSSLVPHNVLNISLTNRTRVPVIN